MREPLWLTGRSICCLRAFIVMTFICQPCKLQKTNLFLLIANIALVKVWLKLIMKCVLTMRVIPHNPSVSEIWNETSWLPHPWHGCENLGTAYEFSTRSAVPPPPPPPPIVHLNILLINLKRSSANQLKRNKVFWFRQNKDRIKTPLENNYG